MALFIAAASVAPPWPRSLPLQALHHCGLAHCRCKRCTTVASLWPHSKQECDWSINNKPVMCWPRQASFSGTDSISDSLYMYVFNFYMYISLVYSKQVSNISLWCGWVRMQLISSFLTLSVLTQGLKSCTKLPIYSQLGMHVNCLYTHSWACV